MTSFEPPANNPLKGYAQKLRRLQGIKPLTKKGGEPLLSSKQLRTAPANWTGISYRLCELYWCNGLRLSDALQRWFCDMTLIWLHIRETRLTFMAHRFPSVKTLDAALHTQNLLSVIKTLGAPPGYLVRILRQLRNTRYFTWVLPTGKDRPKWLRPCIKTLDCDVYIHEGYPQFWNHYFFQFWIDSTNPPLRVPSQMTQEKRKIVRISQETTERIASAFSAITYEQLSNSIRIYFDDDTIWLPTEDVLTKHFAECLTRSAWMTSKVRPERLKLIYVVKKVSLTNSPLLSVSSDEHEIFSGISVDIAHGHLKYLSEFWLLPIAINIGCDPELYDPDVNCPGFCNVIDPDYVVSSPSREMSDPFLDMLEASTVNKSVNRIDFLSAILASYVKGNQTCFGTFQIPHVCVKSAEAELSIRVKFQNVDTGSRYQRALNFVPRAPSSQGIPRARDRTYFEALNNSLTHSESSRPASLGHASGIVLQADLAHLRYKAKAYTSKPTFAEFYKKKNIRRDDEEDNERRAMSPPRIQQHKFQPVIPKKQPVPKLSIRPRSPEIYVPPKIGDEKREEPDDDWNVVVNARRAKRERQQRKHKGKKPWRPRSPEPSPAPRDGTPPSGSDDSRNFSTF